MEFIINYSSANAVTNWAPINAYAQMPSRLAVAVASGAVPDYTIEYTMDASAISAGLTPSGIFAFKNMTQKATATSMVLTAPVAAVRLKVSALATNAATAPLVVFYVLQPQV